MICAHFSGELVDYPILHCTNSGGSNGDGPTGSLFAIPTVIARFFDDIGSFCLGLILISIGKKKTGFGCPEGRSRRIL
uniref:MFS transporter n=1 Tax=Bursaphelenchus xylophilus TaxID=6326 RepID=A0A1I7RLK0_BURXY